MYLDITEGDVANWRSNDFKRSKNNFSPNILDINVKLSVIWYWLG